MLSFSDVPFRSSADSLSSLDSVFADGLPPCRGARVLVGILDPEGDAIRGAVVFSGVPYGLVAGWPVAEGAAEALAVAAAVACGVAAPPVAELAPVED